ITEWASALADLSAVGNQIHMKGVPKVRWNQIGKNSLQLLVIQSLKREPEFAIDPQPGEDSADMGVGGEHLPPERVHHDAVGALPAYLRQRAKELLEFLVGPRTCRI